MHSLDSSGSIPTFILKLWKLVGQEDTNNLICWNRQNGRSFIIKDQAHFAKDVLPLYFKHNNMASFIRQLNMYGFRKVSNIEHGGLKSDGDEVEFFHQNFLQDQEDQLQHIKRKMSTSKSLTSILKSDDFHEIISDVESMRGRQDSVDSMLNNMKRENEALWREVAILRQKHMKQQQIVEKLLHFLVSIVRNQVVGGIKRKTPLMIDASSSNNRKILKTGKEGVCMAPSPTMSGPIISDITDLDENADFSPLMSDASNQLINSLPTNFQASNSKLSNPLEETSILASDVSDVKDSLANMGSLPSSMLDFDLDDVQAANENDSTNDLFNDQLSTGLEAPSMGLDESAIPASPEISLNEMNDTDQNLLGSMPSVSTDLIVPNMNSSDSSSLSFSPEYLTFNNHIDGIDEELKWLQEQLYGGNLSIDPSTILGIFSHDDQFANMLSQEPTTSSLQPKAIMDGCEDPNGKIIKVEENPDDRGLFEDLDLSNIASETKDILNSADLDLDPSTFT